MDTTIDTACTAESRVTRSLLGYGVIAGPVYVTVSVAQGLTKEGFDFGRHAWSMLANGPYGWIQSANLLLTGLMAAAFAVGLARGGAGRGATVLVGLFAAGMAGAGLFPADPGFGFPAGTPDGPGAPTLNGALHLALSGAGLLCLAGAAAFPLARRFAPVASRVAGGALAVGFCCVAAGAGAVWANLAFTAAVVGIMGWMSALALHEYRR
ncbi:uncharacterized protein DUF998 [Actinocorallia herbida]|uniref:Uncharacterized protein DUF998 n=1 Tax=Actinocorallia herbida TaxID=58109 RepID=A0A3N1CQ20_9ACTN|nr:DUF998 domain-containing protein [Actinocorallia herbida]ROO83411.1 uncharacterized protein DUF998 [Actinocorallia herbida]